MFTGIDIGGTNTDIAVIDSLNTYKVPKPTGWTMPINFLIPGAFHALISHSIDYHRPPQTSGQ